MKHTIKAGKPAQRGERRSAAWGKRLTALALTLIANMAFAQEFEGAEREAAISPRITAELNKELALARQGQAGNKNVKVIVTYKRLPQVETLARLQSRGGRLGTRLDLVKGAAFSVPA